MIGLDVTRKDGEILIRVTEHMHGIPIIGMTTTPRPSWPKRGANTGGFETSRVELLEREVKAWRRIADNMQEQRDSWEREAIRQQDRVAELVNQR